MNKRSFLKFFLILSVTVVACQKSIEVQSPTFQVAANSTNISVGDTVVFNIEGNADIISFYSGEIGNDFAYKDQDRILTARGLEMSFQSQVRRLGTPLKCQDNQLSIHMTNDLDFTGATTMTDSAERVNAAEWFEITDLFELCPLECSSTTPYYPSGKSYVSGGIDMSKPFQIGFKYVNKPNTPENGNPNFWRITSLQIDVVTDVGTTSFADQSEITWFPVFIEEPWSRGHYTNSGSIISMRGALSTTIEEQQLWSISEPLAVEEANLGPEYAIGIKSVIDPPLKTFTHVFSAPGTYKAMFIATNVVGGQRSELIREIEIVVAPAE
ncbi:DUF5017 domain-containing protein [Sphingobacterium sp. SGG-5]|uniref:DUF5017 domain-containing protein n=1 Tax=Sphingobacterium sp. SGG-5 TaxID=2710881 RepID=UPI0013EB6700|nr:DUF5017 domain-containing protein [Sphingobacterium sp. SGG-5]NGM61483.1 DUF5017 domain-containing protein [Sphingobacterium sp. SGG-5]